MLKGLDQIDWENLGYHVYHGNEKIPDAVRRLLSQDAKVRDEAREFLLGEGQDYEDIADTTPHIIPFILEILGETSVAGKEDLLDHLSSIANHIFDSAHLPVREMRLHLKTYDALSEGLNILISLLHDTSPSIRLAAADILQYMTNEVGVLIPEFLKICDGEKDESVQIALLKGMKTLLHSLNWAHLDLKTQCLPLFYKVIETHPDSAVRVAAAQAAVEVYERHFKEDIFPKVSKILSTEFLKVSASLDYHKWSEEIQQAIMLIKDLAGLGADPLLTLLQEPEITPLQAHLIARGLMGVGSMMYLNNYYWNCDINYDSASNKLDYVTFSYMLDHLKSFQRQGDIVEKRNRPLQSIIENSKFWQIPTNMFSFFFGLPDSREELYKILSS